MDPEEREWCILHREKSCPCCRAHVLRRPVPVFVVKSVVTALCNATTQPVAVHDADPWKGLFLPDTTSDGMMGRPMSGPMNSVTMPLPPAPSSATDSAGTGILTLSGTLGRQFDQGRLNSSLILQSHKCEQNFSLSTLIFHGCHAVTPIPAPFFSSPTSRRWTSIGFATPTRIWTGSRSGSQRLRSWTRFTMASPPLPPPFEPEPDPEERTANNEQILRNLTARHSSVDDVDLASLFLTPILTNMFLAARRPVDGSLASPFGCIDLLSSKPALHDTLKLAHAEKGYTRVAESPLIPPFVSANARTYLENLRPEMEKVVRGEKTLPPTSLELDKETLLHLESLKLCCPEVVDERYRRFSIILHDLGSFHNDPVLKDRTTRVFSRKNKFLDNSSGTGKTRLLYEGLCQNWGLYFTVGVDSGRLGARDIADTISDKFHGTSFNQFPSHDPEVMKQNSEVISGVFSTLLLARLLLFQAFLETASAEGLTEEHKKQWLLMQLSPALLKVGYGVPACSQFPKILAKEDNTYVRENISDTLRKIRKLLGEDAHLFFVLDEAQVAAKKFSGAFADGKPLLTEIMRVWGSHAAEDHTLIFAGTDIPTTVLEVGEEDSGYLWCSGTGRFDTAEAQERYVSSFFPAPFSKSPSGSLLLSRMSSWLLGRHRFTAAFVRALLLEGFKTPHTRFDAYINEHTGFRPQDALEKVEEENHDRRKSWQITVDGITMSNLSTDDKYRFLEILLRYMATHQVSPPFGPEQIHLVNEGYAVSVDDDLTRITVDEPLVLITAARELFPRPRPPPEPLSPGYVNKYPETFVASMRLNAPRTPQALSHCLVFYLTRVFSEPRPLATIFDFPHKVPAWAKQSAQLVKFHRDENLEVGHSVVLHDDASPLATSAVSLEDMISWLEHQHGTAFCLPSSSSLDLLFALKLADGSFIWVALKAIPSAEPVTDSELKTAVSQLAPDGLFADEGAESSLKARTIDALQALSQRSSKVGKHSLLRVVSVFPADLDLDRCVTKRSQDVAGLSMATLEGAEDEVTQPEFFNAIIAGVLAGQKRKLPSGEDEGPPPRSPKRRKSAHHPADEGPEPTGRPVSRKKGKARAPVDTVLEPAVATRTEGKVRASPDGDPKSAVPPRKRTKGKGQALADEDPTPGEPASPTEKRRSARLQKAANAVETSAPASRNTKSKAKIAEKSTGA
ncbi:hypothetical protein DFH09DRAFT_1425042 [Mycena vulgaris]|nr:hypothetical protein DFH09DRAFT_1425042 [Mycena vulgaris]